MEKIQIDKKFIGNDDPCFIIAEIGYFSALNRLKLKIKK
jgi:sialic acid synthase SpsE